MTDHISLPSQKNGNSLPIGSLCDCGLVCHPPCFSSTGIDPSSSGGLRRGTCPMSLGGPQLLRRPCSTRLELPEASRSSCQWISLAQWRETLGRAGVPERRGLSSPGTPDFAGLNVHQPSPHPRHHVWTPGGTPCRTMTRLVRLLAFPGDTLNSTRRRTPGVMRP